jgi:hypothetical protein
MDIFTLSMHVTGTLAANVSYIWTVPFDCQLIHVSAVGSNANNGILDIGPSTDTDGYLDGKDIGDSQVPIEFDRDDFVNTQYPHITDGTILVLTLDYDGSSATATANFTCVMTFAVG